MIRCPKPSVSINNEFVHSQPRPFSSQIGVSIFAVMSVGLLFLSYFGPLFDHHYSERQPQHSHVYLGDFTPDHVHPFETQHTHAPLTNEIATHEHGVPDGIVYLISNDESGPNSLDTGPTPALQSAGYRPSDPLRSSFFAAENALDGHSVPPLVRPPRI